jgi:hypothetical protein
VSSNAAPQVVIDNGGLDGTNTPLGTLTVIPDIIITNGAVVAPQFNSNSVQNLSIGADSSLLGYANGPYQLIVKGNANLAAGGGILLDATSFFGADPGATVVTDEDATGGGGGHGGYGGASVGGASGGGSDVIIGITAAADVGSPGGRGADLNPENVGGFGGGALNLTVTGILTLNGTISANGGEGAALGSGGGSGGGIEISAGELAGAGSLSVNGGSGEALRGGGGGGGRVAIYSSSNQFAGSVTAYGGAGFVAGGAGTIFLATNHYLIIDNGGLIGTNTPLPALENLNLILGHGARAAMASSQAELESLLIGANCVLTANPEEPQNLSIMVNPGSATIEAGGAISLDGQGNRGTGSLGAGHTVTVNNITTGGGGGNGGYGGASAFGASGGTSLGNINDPDFAGGGGGSGLDFGLGGIGGGNIQLSVAGTLLVNGRVSANGNSGAVEGSGGGAGGSIHIQTPKLTGAGAISVNGGAGQAPYGGGGGGGRVMIASLSNQFNGTITAYGGSGATYGGAGTILLGPAEQAQQSLYQLFIDNGGWVGTNTPLSEIPSPCDLTIAHGAMAAIAPQTTLQNLLIGSNAFALADNSTSFSLLIEGAATIQSGGGIIVDGMGFLGASGAGAGGSGELPNNGLRAGSGAGHGGYGGGTAGGAAYDEITQPAEPGSGGGSGAGFPDEGGAGGGVVQLNVSGLLTVDGIISANGDAATNLAGGGGSGGSIYLTCGGLAGGGGIAANGGSGQLPDGGGGGGGMVAINARSNQFSGVLSAYGGPGYVAGGAGTVYMFPSLLPLQKASGSLLVIDNGGLQGTNTPLNTVSTALIVTLTFDLVVTGGAIVESPKESGPIFVNSLLVQSNGIITQTAGQGFVGLTVQGNATIASTGAIIADGNGYGGGQGPGAGSWSKIGQTGGGGGYGGAGGAGAFGAAGGLPYGSTNLPLDLGSGGGLPAPSPGLSQGGGVIELTVKGTLTINGNITANGLPGRFPGAGGGAGGSIWLTALILNGNGSITANGGAGNPDLGGGGGGGRISVGSLSNTFSGPLQALGAPGNAPGQNGTIYLSHNLPPESNLVPAAQVSTALDAGSGQLNLSWAGSSALTYQVECSTNLADWFPYGNPVIGSNGAMTVAAPCGGPAKFFRIISRN